MLGKNFEYRGLNIPYTTAEGRANGWIADIAWKGISTRDSIQTREDTHGVIVSPSLANGRLITISGDLYDISKTERGLIRNQIEQKLQLEGIPKFGEGFYPLNFNDDDGTAWFINCKVRTPLEYTMDRGSDIYQFYAELFAQDPLIYSQTEKSITGDYGLFGGVSLPVLLPTELAGFTNYFEVENEGNFPSPPTFKITGDIINPKIWNLTTGRFFGIDQTLNAGDELVIKMSDPDNLNKPTAKLNGVNVMADLRSGSELIYILSGTNLLLLTGDNFEFANTDKAQLEVLFRDVKM